MVAISDNTSGQSPGILPPLDVIESVNSLGRHIRADGPRTTLILKGLELLKHGQLEEAFMALIQALQEPPYDQALALDLTRLALSLNTKPVAHLMYALALDADEQNALEAQDIKCRLYPEFLSVFLNTKCNLKCFFCRPEGHDGKFVDFEQVHKLAAPLQHAETIDLTGWGEPFLYPRFEEVLEYVTAVNPRKNIIFLTTNGALLSRRYAQLLTSKLQTMVISVNAATSATYKRDMGGNFEKTISAIREFADTLPAGDRARIDLHFVTSLRNLEEATYFVTLAATLGLSKVSFGQLIAARPADIEFTLLNDREKYNRCMDQAKAIGDRLGVTIDAPRFFGPQNNARPNACNSPFKETFIELDGSCSACCFGAGPLGNVYNDSFDAVWFGKEYRRLRRQRYFPACGSCTSHVPFDKTEAHINHVLKTSEDGKKLIDELNTKLKQSC